MQLIHLDFETESAVDIRNCGAHVYARDKTTGVKCASWALGDGEPSLWWPARFGFRCDSLGPLLQAVKSGAMIAAYNAEFERLIWNHVLTRELPGIPSLQYEQMYCVAVNAYAMTYGRTMDNVAIQIGAMEQKDPRGKELIRRYCEPEGVDAAGNPYYRQDREGLKELGDYCKQDVRTERAILKELQPLSKEELELYHIDQRINDRGFPIDLDLANACIAIASSATDKASKRLVEMTDGEITKPTQRERILNKVKEWGYPRASIGQDVIDQYLASKGAKKASVELIELLEIRRKYGRSAHSKFAAALDRSTGGRVRGSLLMNGARTLRWTGAGVQPQNMKRGLDDPKAQAQAIEAIMTGDLELLELLYGDVMGLLGNVARGLVKAEPGHELITSDYSAIEARVLAVIANDEPNLEAFRAGRCIYRQMGATIAGKAYDRVTKDSEERYIGKQAELAFGYGMGEKTFQARQKLYGRDFKLSYCKQIKDLYRHTHSAIVRFWKRIENDAMKCIQHGVTVQRKMYRFERRKQGMVMIGPSGAEQWYIDPQIVMVPNKWNPDSDFMPVITYSGLAGYLWQRLETYGGKLTENLVQFVSRCIQADAVKAAEKAGFDVVIHTHDEIVAHNPKGEKTVEELEEIMGNASKHWAKEWPIVASGGWKGERYRK